MVAKAEIEDTIKGEYKLERDKEKLVGWRKRNKGSIERETGDTDKGSSRGREKHGEDGRCRRWK